MKRNIVLFISLIAAGCNNSTDNVGARAIAVTAKTKNATLVPVEDSAVKAKRIMEFMTPGPIHRMLSATAGDWTTEETFWLNEQAPPEKSTGTCECKAIMGGRYLQSTYKTTISGMPFEGMSTMGYDNNKKVFVSDWVDNMGTGMMHLEGTMDSATKTLTLNADYEDAAGKSHMREVIRYIDDKHQEMEEYGTQPGGKEKKFYEMKLVKK